MDPVPARVRRVMQRLEQIDRRDREDGTPRSRRLRAIRPEVGELLATIVLATRARVIVEIGTSGGYSTCWLAVAAQRTGGRVITFEIDPAKAAIAQQTFHDAGIDDVVELRGADGILGLTELQDSVDLIFLDAEKEDYERILGEAVSALRVGGTLVADNLESHAEALAGFRHAALSHPRLAGLVAPIGRGELLAVKLA